MIEVKYDNNSTKDRKGKWKSNVVRFLLYMQNGILLSVDCDKDAIFNPIKKARRRYS